MFEIFIERSRLRGVWILQLLILARADIMESIRFRLFLLGSGWFPLKMKRKLVKSVALLLWRTLKNTTTFFIFLSDFDSFSSGRFCCEATRLSNPPSPRSCPRKEYSSGLPVHHKNPKPVYNLNSPPSSSDKNEFGSFSSAILSFFFFYFFHESFRGRHLTKKIEPPRERFSFFFFDRFSGKAGKNKSCSLTQMRTTHLDSLGKGEEIKKPAE